MITERFKTYKAQLQAAKQQLINDCRPLIEQSVQQLFDAAPEIESVAWAQYTPHFNDGEPCTFSRHDVYFTLFDDNPDEEGSYLYDTADLQRAQAALNDARKYASDPAAWAADFCERYERQYGRPYYCSKPRPPYPHCVEEAQDTVNRIAECVERFSDSDRQRINDAFTAFCDVIDIIDDEILQCVYGDGVKICISRSGTEVDYYQHD